MKHIVKGAEPAELSAWKQGQTAAGLDPAWGDFQNPQKRDCRSLLLREQGAICCYCMAAIAMSSMHVEHLEPRASRPELALAWSNLLGCCAPRNRKGSKLETQSHCGEYRGTRSLAITPLQPDCETRFSYDFTGQIHPAHSTDTAARETIANLNLNAESLRDNREKMIREAYGQLGNLAEDLWLRTYVDEREGAFPEFAAMFGWFFHTRWQREVQADADAAI